MGDIKEYVIDRVSTRLIKEEVIYTTENTYNFDNPEKIGRAMNILTEDLDKEHLYVLHLNAKHTLQSINLLSVGTVNSGLVCPREVFKSALLANATGIAIVHNHPSGVVTPSKEDILITKRLVDAGKILGIDVLDHVIVGNGDYYSIREQEGYIFN